MAGSGYDLPVRLPISCCLNSIIKGNLIPYRVESRAWQSSKNQSIGWLSTSNRSSDETTDYQRLITPNNHFLVGSDWFPTIAIVVEKSGDFTVVGCDCLDDCHALRTTPFFLEGRLEKAERRARSGKNKSPRMTRPPLSTIHFLIAN